MTSDRGPLPPIILLVAIVLQLVLYRWLPVATVIAAPWHWGGVALMFAGIGIIAAPAIDFRRSDTTIIPFQESSSLVVGGPYRHTRNPMYLGMLIILVGVAVLTRSLGPFLVPVLFVPILYRRVIRHEEAMLESRFGDEYRRYRREVRRWI